MDEYYRTSRGDVLKLVAAVSLGVPTALFVISAMTYGTARHDWASYTGTHKIGKDIVWFEHTDPSALEFLLDIPLINKAHNFGLNIMSIQEPNGKMISVEDWDQCDLTWETARIRLPNGRTLSYSRFNPADTTEMRRIQAVTESYLEKMEQSNIEKL